MDKKLTDNDIIKALECCSTYTSPSDCKQCPLRDACEQNTLDTFALDLINRQKAEIDSAKLRYEEIKADRDKEHQYAMHYARMCAKAKSEARKEFAEHLKCGVPQETGVIRCKDVDKLLEEMEGKDGLN